MVKYLSKKNAADQAIAEYDTTFLRYLQQANITPQQYDDDLIANSCKVANVYNEGTLNDLFIKEVDQSISHSLQNCCAANPGVDLSDIDFQAD